jgi:tetratricopeptide (TPR) repeat protein
MVRKMYLDAIEMYRKALPNPQDYVLYNKIGIAYQHMENSAAAKRHYEMALKANPKYAEARNNLGTLAYGRKDYRGAIREYERSIALNPNIATTYSNLGTAYFARKRYEEAAKAYRQALLLDPDVFESHSGAGTLLQDRTVEERARFYYYMAKTYAEAGMIERALISMRRALEEGFKDRKKFVDEPAFANMQDLPEFQRLVAMEPRAL